MKKPKKKKPKKSQPMPVMPGCDFGLEHHIAVLGAVDFNNDLRSADVMGCAYGFHHSQEVDASLPIVYLIAKNPELLKQALLQFKAWMDATGPDALNVEILYSEHGYHISFAPDPKHLLWRTVGLDQTIDPLISGLIYVKKIDTRHPFLDKLAAHAQLPIAPVIISGAQYIGPDAPGPGPLTIHSTRPIPDCPSLFLLRLPIYKDPSEVPETSGLMSFTQRLDKKRLSRSRDDYPHSTRAPVAVFRRREQRLASLMPITLHLLRTQAELREKVRALAGQDYEIWQVEQAAINQRVWALLPPETRRTIQNPKELFSALSGFVEGESPEWRDILADEEAILKQVDRDLRFFLRGLGITPPDSLSRCQAALDKRGYRRLESSA
jgi:hypothetical protein